MDLPAKVLVHNELLGIKGSLGTLMNISELGYFEVNLKFGDKAHRVLMPIQSTVVIAQEADEPAEETIEVER